MWLRIPQAFTQLQALSLCAGYQVSRPNGQRTVAHQEHRMVLVAAWAAKKDGLWTNPPFLLRLDAHEDYPVPRADDDGREILEYDYDDGKLRTLEDCLLFANALSPDDGGWVEAAVKLGWVSDVLTIGVQEWRADIGEVRDLSGSLHRISKLLWDTSCHVSKDARDGIAKACAAAPIALRNPAAPLWLDIDLDAAIAIVDRTRIRVRGDCEFQEFLERPLRQIGADSDRSIGQLLSAALRDAQLVTIATEPEFCGGHAGVARAIELMERTIEGADRLQVARMA